ncbi:MAG: RNA polymerase sigma factor [Candidatus Hydrogenedentes bacterium]|nr:RNA polymerase sigma factor [Candidatus Hydrogenedentota bacterium]
MNKREQIDDELLVLRAQTGDSDAMGRLVERWQPRLWAFARVLTGDDEGAWDVMQEVWVAVIGGLPRLEDPARFRPWIFRIVRYKAADRIRSNQRQRKLLRERAANPGQVTTAAANEVRELLSAMPEQDGSLLALHYLEGVDYEELAAILDVPLGTVKSRLYKARQEFKKMLEHGHGRV